MNTILKISILALLLVTAPNVCFALREIMYLTKDQAQGMGIELRAKPAGTNAVWLELEFKPEGKLNDFTHVELNMADKEKSHVVSTSLREKRSSSGSVVVSLLLAGRYLEKTSLSIVMHSPREAGDHTCELRMKDFVDLKKLQ